ncbi:MAG: P-loop containing nucleoside triphosphate hydrolase protein [Benniella sp.]|nr:MAG: P-loop containing nucleoside triphosphate hydrolase protein [Benniella sp.]
MMWLWMHPPIVGRLRHPCQALILASSPQAALRIQKIILAFGSYDVHCHACTNQADLREDRMRLKKGAQIVVGTPGCIHELIGHGTIITKNLRVLILDRVDEMYNGKIKEIIEELLQSIPRSAQVAFLLSKMSKELKDWTTKFMHNPEFIDHDTEMPDLEDSESLLGSIRLSEDKPYEMEFKQDEVVENFESFENMKLNPELLRGIYANGLKRPSTIQQRIIQPIFKNQDVILQAHSGTDRIVALSIPILQRLDLSNKQCQALILVSSHELAQQVREVVAALGFFMKAKCHASVGGPGGSNIKEDIARIGKGIHVIVGTLGRLLDMIKRGKLKTEFIKTFVMDEGMLSQTFKDQFNEVFQRMPSSTQVVLITTAARRTEKVATKFLRDPVRVVAKGDGLSPAIKQFYLAMEKEEAKLDTLCKLCDTIPAPHIVIFCNTHLKVRELMDRLVARKYTVSAILRTTDETQREAIMEAFGSGTSRILILTDLLAYRVDEQPVSLVINYELPIIKEDYSRRVGLASRDGNNGVAINLVSGTDMNVMKRIEQLYSMRITEMAVDEPVNSEEPVSVDEPVSVNGPVSVDDLISLEEPVNSE